MKIEFYPEVCCEYCMETIHNHMNCPACNKRNAGTSAYGEVDSYYETISCEECNAKFKLVKSLGYNEWECELVKEA